MSDRFRRVEEIFHAAAARDGADRVAFIAEACGSDDRLRLEVESLLANTDSGDHFLDPPRLATRDLVGRELGTYRVEELIGSGGMGDVYRARDTRLNRAVAIKLLPGDLLVREGSFERFDREARAASSLNHPNIVTIHEIGHADGLHFIVQELIEGQTLRQRLAQGPLAMPEILGIARQLATGLAAAHAAGVIHRDIKPENVMLRTDGYIKILDFGVAKLIGLDNDRPGQSADGPTASTARGLVVGTTRYMSPEQARGQRADQRSDIFSLGIVLYEMAAGKPPFVGATTSDVLAAVLTRDPAPLADSVPGISTEFDRLVGKALRKDPAERYQSAIELLADLRVIEEQTGASRAGRRPDQRRLAWIAAASLLLLTTIGLWFVNHGPALTEHDAILLTDFQNTTGEAVFDGQALKRGLEIQLRQTPFLKIVQDESVRTALVMMARSPDEPVTRAIGREICQRQGLKAMVTGDIARLGTAYVITLQGVATETGDSIAIEQTQADDQKQVLVALGQAAMGLRRKLGESLATLQRFNAPIEQATTSSLDALKAYSAGLELSYAEKGRSAVPFFVRATQMDPQFVAAYDNGAWALAISGDPAAAARFADEGYRLRERATERERLSAEATYHHFSTGDLDEENRLCTVWKRLYANDWIPVACLAFNYLSSMARHEEAAALGREIIRISPDVAQGYRFLAPALMHLNRFDEAAEVVRGARARALDNVFLRPVAFQLAFVRGDPAATQREAELIRKADGEAASARLQARALAFAGRMREARALRSQVQAALDALVGVCDPKSPGMKSQLDPARILPGRGNYPVMLTIDGSVCGEIDDAVRFADALATQLPRSTVTQRIILPLLRAGIELRRNEPARALDALRAASPLNRVTLHQSYLRGQALMRLRRGREAAAEFQFILDHRGWDPTSLVYPLAQLGLARAAALAGDSAASRQAYGALFAIWKEADADLPPLVAARREYAQLR